MTAQALETAREEFDKIVDESEDDYYLIVEMSNPPEDADAKEWPNDAYSLIDATLEVLMQQDEPLEAVAIVLGSDGEDDAKCVQGKLTLGGGDNHMYSIGDTGFDDAGDLDAIAVTGGGDDVEAYAEHL